MWQLTGTMEVRMRAIKRKNLYSLANTKENLRKRLEIERKKKDKQLARIIPQETNHLHWALKSQSRDKEWYRNSCFFGTKFYVCVLTSYAA